jgi:hypothetical protein
MSFHDFGGGLARMTELSKPSMLHCLFTNGTVYYSLSSIKVFNHASQRFKEVERKLPTIVGRYFLLFRSILSANQWLFQDSDVTSSILPRRINSSDVGASHVIRDLFSLDSLPDMTQVRQFWACVSNFVTGGKQESKYLTSSDIAASKMGHSSYTHATTYSSEGVGIEEMHFNCYHFALGDTSYQESKKKESLSLADLRAAMRLRYPGTKPIDGHNYLSLQQKELVEFGYSSTKGQHCLGLLAPGGGKSDCYIIPTIARKIANQDCRTIIHVSPKEKVVVI